MSWIFYITRGKRGGDEDDSPTYHCAHCHEPVGKATDQIQVFGRPARKTYVNPHGIDCEIVTLGACQRCGTTSHSSLENTWFEGYAWRPLTCGRCSTFLGWRFEATHDALDGPKRFYGLLVEWLVIV